MAGPEHLIEALAAERSGGTVSLRLAWRLALALLPELPQADLTLLGRALPTPAGTLQFARMLGREGDPAAALAQFLRDTGDSEEPLEEWLRALAVLERALEGTIHRPTLTEATGYLHCCEAVAHTGARYETLAMTVETMLETHGYAGPRG